MPRQTLKYPFFYENMVFMGNIYGFKKNKDWYHQDKMIIIARYGLSRLIKSDEMFFFPIYIFAHIDLFH